MKFDCKFPLASFSAPDLEMLRKMKSATDKAARQIMEQTERLLVERLEIHLGRLPSDDEIRQHGFCGIYPDGTREFKWKGETFLRIAPIFKPQDHV